MKKECIRAPHRSGAPKTSRREQKKPLLNGREADNHCIGEKEHGPLFKKKKEFTGEGNGKHQERDGVKALERKI